MLWWLNQGPGRKYKNPVSRPTYLGTHSDQPFPLNPLFRSQPVLDEHTKELIWKKVIQRGDAIKAVSAEMGVDVRRVAAVVRMKQIEKQWVQQVSLPSPPLFLSAFTPLGSERTLRDEIHTNSISL